MSSDVALNTWQMDSPLTIITTPSQAGDSPAPADDRIFFGPLQSPEKKYAFSPSAPRFRTPIRRSTRLSSAMVPLPLFPEEGGAVGGSDTREGTPEDESFADEPSIILASRVLSACSNPSPPPTPPLLPQHTFQDCDDAQLIDVLDPQQGRDAEFGTPTGPAFLLDELSGPVATSSPFEPRSATPTPRHTEDQANTSQPDLITFDSFPATDPGDNHSRQEPQTILVADSDPVQPVTKSVDELFSISPRPSLASPIATINELIMPNAHLDKESTATPNEEVGVTCPLAIEVDPPASPPLIDMAVPEDEGVTHLVMPSEEPPVSDHQTPPLRRSTRPRKSRSSLPQTIVDTSPQPPSVHEGVEDAGSGAAVVQKPNDAQESPQRKRKLKLTPKPEDKGEGSSMGVPITPRRLTQVTRVHRELGSLSPMSAAVLTQLLPKPSGDSASRSTTPQPPQDDSVPHPDAAPAVSAPATPPLQTPAFVFPKVSQSDVLGDASRPKSPLRPFSPSRFAEGSRTPARRVPIAQAIADGTYSAHKLPAAFGAVRPPNQPGSPVFKKLALDDPARSPAKRVLMNEAVLVPPPSPEKSVDKGKGRATTIRPQSTVRSSSVPPRERTASAEPPSTLSRRERGASAEPSARPVALGRRPFFQKPASSDGVSTSSMQTRTTLPYPLRQQQRSHPTIPEAEEPGTSAVRPAAPGASTVANGAAQTLASPAKAGSSLRQPSAGVGSRIPRIGAKPYARTKPVGAAPSKLPTPSKPKTVTRGKPLRIVNVGSSGSSSDEGHSNAASLKPRPIVTPQSSSSSTAEGGQQHGVKRKRELEVLATRAAAPGAQSVTIMRKVVPGMFNKKPESATGATSTSRTVVSAGSQIQTQPAIPISPAKQMGPIKARSAVGWKRPQPEGRPPPAAADMATEVEVPHPKERSPEREPAPALLPVVVNLLTEPPKETRQPAAPPPGPSIAPTTSAEVPSEPARSIPVSVIETAPESATGPTPESQIQLHTRSQNQPQTHRRSTRSKRTAAPSGTITDVFGSVLPTAISRPLSRRRGPLPSEIAGPFAGMTALALKTLTSTHTLKNQRQVATIETEVIRKDGARPESPTSRVRSALEKQKEERVQQRKERAERRARRSAGSDVVDADAAAGSGEQGLDGASEAGDASFASVEQEGSPHRHRRGPGEEEDYETPPRPERPAKRGRFDEGVEAGSEKQTGADGVAEKRVKWDRGLHTTVYLDDTLPKPKWDTRAVPSQKSCLAAAAKALRLDTLGNVLNAELPVGGLVKEHIVVKKFVFDDDVQPEAQSPAPAPTPAPAVKSTRNKTKRAKP